MFAEKETPRGWLLSRSSDATALTLKNIKNIVKLLLVYAKLGTFCFYFSLWPLAAYSIELSGSTTTWAGRPAGEREGPPGPELLFAGATSLSPGLTTRAPKPGVCGRQRGHNTWGRRSGAEVCRARADDLGAGRPLSLSGSRRGGWEHLRVIGPAGPGPPGLPLPV